MPFLFFMDKQVVSFFNFVTYILHFKPLCCICIISDLFLSLVIVILLSYYRPFFAQILCIPYSIIDKISFTSWVDFIHSKYLIVLDGKIGRNYPAWMKCSFNLSYFLIFTHNLLVDQKWPLINKCKFRHEVVIKPFSLIYKTYFLYFR